MQIPPDPNSKRSRRSEAKRIATSSAMRSAKKKWREANKPVDGFYICWLCEQPVAEDKVSLDHVAPLHLYPEYATNISNLKPSHKHCNQQRGQEAKARLVFRFGRQRQPKGLIHSFRKR